MAKTNEKIQANGTNGSNGEDGLAFGRTAERVFVLKTGTEVHEKYNDVKVPFVVAGYGRTAEESMQNMLDRTGGDHVAVVDLFNSAFALALQKSVKGLTGIAVTKGEDGKEVRTDPTATVDELVSHAREYVGVRNQRKGTGETRKVEKQKASMLDELLKASPEDRLRMLAELESRAQGI